jgi:xanthine dehydrogenase YagS FAD-binding subunit
VHPSDLAVALAALDADVVLLGPAGERRIPFRDLHRLPGERPDRDTTVEHGELITAVEIAPLPFAANSAYRKVRDRASYAFALVSVAAALDVVDGVVRDARIAFGGVAHRPWRAYRAEDSLRGLPAADESFRAAAAAELSEAVTDNGNAFKVPIITGALTAVLRGLTTTSGGRA